MGAAMLEIVVDILLFIPELVSRFLRWLWEFLNDVFAWIVDRIKSRR
jgi:hypothetical protein